MIQYIIEVEEVDEDAWYVDDHATVVRVDADGTRTEVGWIGGEPEDNTHYRNYSWIVPELNDAYRRGVEDGRAI